MKTISHFLLFTFVLGLTACTSSWQSRSWDEFIPHSDEVETEMVSDIESPPLTNGQTFPHDCDWEAYARTVDGDTILLEDGVRVRFQGIDTPESKHPEKPVEPFALKASDFTKDLLETSQRVCLMTSSKGDSYDKYGRRLAYVFSEFGTDVNAELLRAGLARGYFKYPFDRFDEFKRLEAQAKQERRSIWGGRR